MLNRATVTGANKVLLFFTLLYLVFQLILSILTGIYGSRVLTGTNLYIILLINQYVVVLIPVLFYVWKNRLNPKKVFRLNKLRLKPAILILLLSVPAYFAAAMLNNIIVFLLQYYIQVPEVPVPVPGNVIQLVISLLILAVSPAICEELMHRGLFLNAFERRGTVRAIFLTAIIFGGRRAKTAPLVYQSFNWEHGTFVGSIMASETTAAAAGAVGVVRRDPMAMLPFCGYNMGNYFQHWLDMEKTVPNLPKIFHVNWFRLNENGSFMWPGFGDNFRVLEWIIKRCEDKVDAEKTAIGYIPKAEDINLTGLDYEIEAGHKFGINDLKSILTVEKDCWLEDTKSIEEFYNKIGDTIPAQLRKQLADLKERLSK
jgi:membrane protease YdiL (CAAX protease family)